MPMNPQLQNELARVLAQRMPREEAPGRPGLVGAFGPQGEPPGLGSMLAAELSKMAENHPINEMSPLEIALGFTGATTPARGIRAYHGSPYKFDKFDFSKIGEGQGAQAYGHGLYAAEAEGVADWTRAGIMKDAQHTKFEVLSEAENATLPAWVKRSIENDKSVDPMLADFKSRKEDALWKLSSPDVVQPWLIKENIRGFDKMIAALSKLKATGNLSQARGGHMYEVNIKADPEDFLDWDAPLSGQSEGIQQALKDAGLLRNTWAGHLRDLKATGEFVSADRKLNLTGAQFYHDMGAKASASEALRKAGIPGIKYKDQMSRGKEGGTHNYVTFSDDIIEIIRRYGILPLIGGAGGGGLAAAMSGQVFPEGGGA